MAWRRSREVILHELRERIEPTVASLRQGREILWDVRHGKRVATPKQLADLEEIMAELRANLVDLRDWERRVKATPPGCVIELDGGESSAL